MSAPRKIPLVEQLLGVARDFRCRLNANECAETVVVPAVVLSDAMQKVERAVEMLSAPPVQGEGS